MVRIRLRSLLLAGLLMYANTVAAQQKFYGPTKFSDTLWNIAAANKSKDVSLFQMMAAIYTANKQAFTNGDINILKAHSKLLIPSDEVVLQTDRKTAYATIQKLSDKAAEPATNKVSAKKIDAAQTAASIAAKAKLPSASTESANNVVIEPTTNTDTIAANTTAPVDDSSNAAAAASIASNEADRIETDTPAADDAAVIEAIIDTSTPDEAPVIEATSDTSGSNEAASPETTPNSEPSNVTAPKPIILSSNDHIGDQTGDQTGDQAGGQRALQLWSSGFAFPAATTPPAEPRIATNAAPNVPNNEAKTKPKTVPAAVDPNLEHEKPEPVVISDASASIEEKKPEALAIEAEQNEPKVDDLDSLLEKTIQIGRKHHEVSQKKSTPEKLSPEAAALQQNLVKSREALKNLEKQDAGLSKQLGDLDGEMSLLMATLIQMEPNTQPHNE